MSSFCTHALYLLTFVNKYLFFILLVLIPNGTLTFIDEDNYDLEHSIISFYSIHILFVCVLGPALPFTGRLEQRTWSNKKKIVKITGPMTICIDSFINCNELFPFLIYREVNLTHLVRYSFLYKTHFESFKLILTLLTYY